MIDADKRRLADVNNKLFNSAVDAGLTQSEAKHNADIMAHAIASMVDTDNISVDKVLNCWLLLFPIFIQKSIISFTFKNFILLLFELI